MLKKVLFLLLVASLATLLTAAPVQAWGAFHAGYTHVGPAGVQHYGHTTAVGTYGAYSGSHYGAYGYGGASYHAGYGYGTRYGEAAYGGYYAYTPSYESGYAVGGYHYGTYGTGYRAGVYRAW